MWHREQHKKIQHLLDLLNTSFLKENNILFGGGTRISLEIDEYRVSTDADFICIGNAYRVIRNELHCTDFGRLFTRVPEFARETRADRYAVRMAPIIDGTPLKLEFIAFDRPQLSQSIDQSLGIASLAHKDCFTLKLMALADRTTLPLKDYWDILAMRERWGKIPESSFRTAREEYGEKCITNALNRAHQLMNSSEQQNMITQLQIEPCYAKKLIAEIEPKLQHEISHQEFDL